MRQMLIAFLVLTAASTVARAESVALLPAQGINVDVGTLQAARDILEGHLSRGGRFHVRMVGDPARQDVTPAQVLDAGRDAKTDFAAVLRITRLGSNSRAKLVVYRVPSGETCYSGDLVATSADDLDGVLRRLALGLDSNASPGKTEQLGNLTNADMSAPIVHSVRMRAGLSVVALAAFNRPGSSSSATAAGASAFIYFDAETVLWDGFLQLMGHDRNVVFNAGVGAYYPLSANFFAPYVGGAVQFSAARYGGGGANGIAPEATLGLIIGRTASSQLRVQASYFFDLFSEQPNYQQPNVNGPPFDGSAHYVHGILFSLGFCTRV